MCSTDSHRVQERLIFPIGNEDGEVREYVRRATNQGCQQSRVSRRRIVASCFPTTMSFNMSPTVATRVRTARGPPRRNAYYEAQDRVSGEADKSTVTKTNHALLSIAATSYEIVRLETTSLSAEYKQLELMTTSIIRVRGCHNKGAPPAPPFSVLLAALIAVFG